MVKTVVNKAPGAAGPVEATAVTPARGLFDIVQDARYWQLYGVNGAVNVDGVEIEDAGYIKRPTATSVRVVLWNKTKRLRNGTKIVTIAGQTFELPTVRIVENGW